MKSLTPFAIAALAITAAPAAAHRAACGPVVHAAVHHRALARPAVRRVAYEAADSGACDDDFHGVQSYLNAILFRHRLSPSF